MNIALIIYIAGIVVSIMFAIGLVTSYKRRGEPVSDDIMICTVFAAMLWPLALAFIILLGIGQLIFDWIPSKLAAILGPIRDPKQEKEDQRKKWENDVRAFCKIAGLQEPKGIVLQEMFDLGVSEVDAVASLAKEAFKNC